MKRRIVLIPALLAVVLVVLPAEANVTATPGSLPCALSALLAPPVKTVSVLGSLVTQTKCDYAHEACYQHWRQDYYTSCIYLEGDATDLSYSGCSCKSARGYQGCMRAWGCDSKGWAYIQPTHGDCFTSQ